MKIKLQLFSFVLPAFLLDAYLPAIARSPRPDDNPWERVRAPSPSSRTQSVGFYSGGCLDGAIKIPPDGEGYHLMRLSRNRFWAHPSLLNFLTALASEAQQKLRGDSLLFGDVAQPRGGPFTKGHASHQIGLDADIWQMTAKMAGLRGIPSSAQRENVSAVSLLNPRGRPYPTQINPPGVPDLNPQIWNSDRVAVLKAAALHRDVERIFVHPYIKKALCQEFGIYGLANSAWLRKIRPWWGHDAHFHVRLRCPADSPDCRPQEATPPGDGCGDDLAWWFSNAAQEEWRRIEGSDSVFRLPKLPERCADLLK